MAFLTPLYMQNDSGPVQYPAQAERAALLSAIFSREGVLDTVAGQLLVTQRLAGANFTVDVAAGRAAVIGDDQSDQGSYVCTSTTPVNITVPAKPGSGTRYHRVILRIRDKLMNPAWSQYDFTIELLADTGAGLPALPNSAISLAQITVSSATTSIVAGNIADLRPMASVGTADRTGSIVSALHPTYYVPQGSRPPRYSVNPDGWVQLGGWVRRQGGNTNITAYTQYSFNPGSPLPKEVLPASGGYRDFVGISSIGALQYSVMPTGELSFLSFVNTSLVSGQSWFSFDGCGWKL